MPEMEQRRRFITNAAYIAVWLGVLFLVFRYFPDLVWPFAAAYLFAWLLKPAIRWLTVRWRIKYKLSSALCLFAFFAILGGAAALVTTRAASVVADLLVRLPSLYSDTIEPGMEALSGSLESIAERLDPAVYDMASAVLPDVVSSVGAWVTDASMRLVAALSGWAAKLPSHLLSALVCLIATIIMTVDFPRMNAFILRQLPERPRHVLTKARDSLAVILRKFGKGYGVIMCVTFAEIFAGLLLIGQENAALIALAIAVFDIFPVVGAGMILVPWGAVTMLGGNIARGAGFLALWAVTIVVRQVIEPRIVGRQVGLHPLITLAAIYVGSKLFGSAGFFCLPILCAIVQSLDEAGVIRLIRREEDGAGERAEKN